ncbi:MAG: response regulator, partial [Magnetococcales bacterium]|nr:response regulator [Magnetococcales bacterium]
MADKLKVMIIDDAPGNIKVLATILRESYEVIAVTSGPLALKMVAENPPSLILLDVRMPEMDGYEVCQELKKDIKTRNIPIIFVTSKDLPDDVVRGFSMGAVDFITKPVTPAVVRARVKTHIELSEAHLKLLLLDQKERRLQLARKTETLTSSMLDLAPVSEKFKAIAQFVVENYGMDGCRIWMFRPEEVGKEGCSFALENNIRDECRQKGCCIHLTTSHSQEIPFDANQEGIPLGHDQIQPIIASKTGRIVSNDLANDDRFRSHFWARNMGLVSFAGFQLRNRKAAMVGALASYSRHHLDEETVTALTQLAILASQVIVGAQDREEIESAMHHAQAANRAKTAFLATINHEIRTPMNAIVGMADLLADTKLDERQRNYLDRILKGSSLLLSVINAVLDFSKIEAGKMTLAQSPFDPGNLVEDVCATLANSAFQKGLELACHVGWGVPDQLLGDDTRLQQVLINLVGNAIKFTHSGRVVVRVTLAQDLKQTDIANEDHSILLHFTVSDSGMGIPKDQLENIFAPFQQIEDFHTRRFGGTGLGLTICQRLINLMKGHLWVESQEGKGSQFHFTILFKTVVGKSASNDLSKNRMDLSGRRVIISDALPISREILTETLIHWGADVVNASDIQNTRDKIRLAAANNAPFDFLILDIRFSERQELQQHVPMVPERGMDTAAMLISSPRQMSQFAQGVQDRNQPFILFRPIKRSDLVRVFEGILRKGEPTPDSAHAPSFAPPSP